MPVNEEGKVADAGKTVGSSEFGPYGADQRAAAIKLQGLYRSRTARKNIQLLLRSVYEKVYDVGSLQR